MGTSLSGLTPATTFDGLLKTSDNDSIGTGLKTIGTGDGTDSVLQLSDSQLNVAGQFSVDTDTSLTTMNLRGDSLVINQIYQANETTYNSIAMANSAGIQFKNLTNTTAVIRSNKFGLGIGGSTDPLATAHIKGSGATSATTSLLVQNSAGTELLKVRDDNVVSAATFSSTVSRLSYINTITNSYTVMQSHLADGNASFYQSVAVGQTTTPTARLQVKGSGNDNTTTSLLVQNSDGADSLIIKDDRSWEFNGIGANSSAYIYTASDRIFFRAANKVSYLGQFRTSGFQIGNGANDPIAKLQVKGSGATSATTALLVQNSAGTEHLKVTDDGEVNVRESLYVNHATVSSRYVGIGWGAISANSTADELSIYGGGATLGSIMYLNGSTKSSAPQAIGMKTSGVLIAPSMVQSSFAPDASAQLQVDSTTKGFLPPRMTTTERDAISTPAAGLMVYNTTTNKAQCYNGTTWNDLF